MGARWGEALRLNNNIHTGITVAPVIILTREGVTGLMLKVRKFKLINGKLQASGYTYRFVWPGTEELLSPPVQPHLLPSLPLSLLLIYLTISMLLEHASTLPQGKWFSLHSSSGNLQWPPHAGKAFCLGSHRVLFEALFPTSYCNCFYMLHSPDCKPFRGFAAHSYLYSPCLPQFW